MADWLGLDCGGIACCAGCGGMECAALTPSWEKVDVMFDVTCYS